MKALNKPVDLAQEDALRSHERMRISNGQKIRNRPSEYITRADLATGSLEYHLSKLPKRKVKVQ